MTLDDVRRLRQAQTKATAELRDAVVSAYKSDVTVSMRTIGDAAGMSEESVRQLLHARGVSVRPRGGAWPTRKSRPQG